MKRIGMILFTVLFALTTTYATADNAPAVFSVPEVCQSIPAHLDPSALPQDLPEKAVTITSASFNGSSLSVELSCPVPSLSITQYSDEGDTVLIAFAENVASLSADSLDPFQGMADVIISWKLSDGELSSIWTVWSDSSFDFLQCRYSSEKEAPQAAPYTMVVRTIEMDEQQTVLSDTYEYSNDMDGFVLGLNYDASGTLTDYSCEWTLGDDGTLYAVRILSDQTLSSVSYHNESTDFEAASEPIGLYLSGNSLVLDTVDYDPVFLSALSDAYPQLPEPETDSPFSETPSTPTDLDTDTDSSPDVDGTLWCVCFGSGEERMAYPFFTKKLLFSLKKGSIVLNTAVKDVNGTAASFPELTFKLPALSLPVIQ